MLQVPVHTVIEDVTIYSDDALFYVYYLIPETPTVRLDAHGKPVFLLVAYEFSAQDRAANAELPTGGGYLNFDTELAVAPATLARLRVQLQAEVDSEWNRRRAGSAAEQASLGVAGTTEPPPVRFDVPTWTAGKVRIDAPQSQSLISARVSEGTPSLLQGDTAVFNLDLTPAGATFLEQTMTAPQGNGATDLTPIQVGYDLSFWARLPAASIVIKADSSKVHEYIRQQMQGRGVDNCTTYDFDNTDLTTDTVTASGAITVAIDQGSGSLPAEVLAELRDYAMDLVKQMITSAFFSSDPPAGQHDLPAPIAGSGNTNKFYLKDYNSAEMHLDVRLEQRSVVEWQIHPQATIESFFHGMPSSELSRYIRKISLDDPFWRTLDVDVRTFADWDGPVSWVQVDLEYGKPGTDLKSGSFTFDAAHNEAAEWSQNIIDGDVSFRYRTTIAFDDHDAPTPSQWTSSTVPVVNVQAAAPTLDITVLAGDIDFTTVAKVEVILAYEDPDHGVSREEHSIVLSNTITQGNYQRVVYQPITRPATYRTRSTLVSGAVQDSPDWHPVTGPQLVINSDRSAMLRVGLLPAGDGWADVMRVMVELDYTDGPYQVSETLDLDSLAQFKTWSVALRNPGQRSFRYRWVASFKNGQLEPGEWKESPGDSDTIPIVINRPGFIVTLMPDTIDFAITPLVQVTCRYTRPGLEREETFVFTDRTAQNWLVDVPTGSPTDFEYTIAYSVPGRDPLPPTPMTGHGSIVVLPPYHGPHPVTVTILGGLVDYQTTPLVGVDTTVDQGPNTLPLTTSFTLSDTQVTANWVFTPPTGISEFGYRITYFTTDGKPHPQPPQHDSAPRIIVPKFVAS